MHLRKTGPLGPWPIRYGWLLALCLCGAAGTLPAQAPAPQVPFPRYTFSTLYWDGTERFHYSTVESVERLRTNPDLAERLRRLPLHGEATMLMNKSVRSSGAARSLPQAYRGPARLEFFAEPPREVQLVQEDGTVRTQVQPPPIAAVTLPDPEKRWLLLISERDEPGPDGHLYDISVMDDSPTTFPLGSYRFMNLLGREVGVRIADRPAFRLGPRAVRVFDPGVDERKALQVLFMDATISRDRPAYSNEWFHEPTMRMMVFVREARGGRSFLDVTILPETQRHLQRPPR